MKNGFIKQVEHPGKPDEKPIRNRSQETEVQKEMECAMKNKKQLFTKLIALLMILSILPMGAFAETAEENVVTDTSESISIWDLFQKPDTEEEETEAEVPSVQIFSSFNGVIGLGDLITLTSVVDGEVAGYQWECDKGEGFEPIEGANESSYAFEATVESLGWNWRLTVTRPAEEN